MRRTEDLTDVLKGRQKRQKIGQKKTCKANREDEERKRRRERKEKE